nr:PREDICTED: uncharacterized protein LOC105673909 isoform X1 [Linepithema humile]XP_012225314.1 PREDICTED: uncharacterized protein LOC105673909 isoform X1 [Linepithema humile]XP_012225315.1 PREDICTED: uncharacterized protein LOC105673909 isoform X1 [Linepithema humile]XP_012225316.1 PREDICTED: uncharacterized protein LOC105673909 isoform X1 [Linepithema humile]
MSLRNVSSERRSKPVIDRKRSASAGTSSQKTRSSKDENPAKSSTMKSQGLHERQLLLRKENKKDTKVRDNSGHKGRLPEETSVASTNHNNPIYILRKEIHDWRMLGQDGFEQHIIEDEMEKSFVQENYNQAIVKNSSDPDIFPELPSSVIVDQLTQRTENLSSPESCNVCSATSPDEMTSVRMCYCKQKDNTLRKKDNDVRVHNGNGHLATITSKKSVITNETYGNSGRSPRRSVIGGKMLNANWSVEEQPINTILSPETSTALENAEKIINNAKIQLMEVCGMSSIDSARRCRNTYSDLPLDNESEELLYIRELVACKFDEATSSRSETNGKTSVNSKESARLTVRRTDLSAPKFRTTRRRHADWSSLGYGSDNRSCGRAPPAEGAPSKDSIENAATMPGDCDRRRASSVASIERELVRARGNACRIQTGPSVHIVDRELTKQNLDDVHISPESSWAQSRANIATYRVHHGENIPENVASEPEASKALKTLRVRLGTPRQHERPVVAEIATKTATDASSKSKSEVEYAGNNGLLECPKFQAKDHAREKSDRALDGTRISGHAERVKDREGMSSAAIDNSRDEKLRSEPRKEDQAEITSGGDTNGRYAEDRRIFDKKSGVGKRNRLRSDGNVEQIREENRSDRSKLPLVGDASGRTSFLRCENIASPCRATTSQQPRRTIIDEHLSNTFDSHDELQNVDDEARRSFASSCSDDFQAEDDPNEIDLYRPHFEDLDSILSLNDKKIERTVRAVKTFDELSSRFEFAKDQLDEGERNANFEEFYDNSSKIAFALNEPARSSILETESKNEDLVRASETRRKKMDANPQATSVDTVGRKSSFAKDNDSPSNCSKNLVESSAYPASDANNGSRTPRKRDKTQKSKSEAHSSASSLDKWDVTTFSNIVPALSSTRTETQDTHRDVKSRATTACKFSELDRPQKEHHSDSIFTYIARSLKDDAADRFVAYFLQDEKQSVERKVTSAVKESAIEPATIRKLLDRLREAETICDARRTETLDILKNVLINVEKETDRGVSDEDANDEEKAASQKVPASSIAANAPPNTTADLISREESTQQAKTKVDEIERVVENSRNLKNGDEHTSGLLELRETKGSVRFACDSAPGSKSDSKMKENSCSESESLKQISDIRSDDDKNSGENLQNLSAKTAKSDDRMETDGRDAAIAPSGNEEGHINNEKHENEPARVQDNKDSTAGERRENKSVVAAADSHKDENKTSGLVRSDNEQQMTADLARLDISREAFDAVKETRVEARHKNNTSADKESAFLNGSETKNERVHSEASFAGSKFADKVAAKKDASLACSTAQENIESLHENNARQLEEKIGPADCRSADSLRDYVSLLSLKNSGSSLKDVASTNKHISPNFAGENNSKDVRGDDIFGKSIENRRNGNKEGGLLNGAKSDNEKQPIDRTNALRKYKINIPSSSNSSISSALLDHDDRFSNGALSTNSKKIETSSEASYSEGELYMPSSCSYSLGEVRILKKRDFIVDSTTDRDSSMTVLITRSMLTSLNDSTASLLEDSGHI